MSQNNFDQSTATNTEDVRVFCMSQPDNSKRKRRWWLPVVVLIATIAVAYSAYMLFNPVIKVETNIVMPLAAGASPMTIKTNADATVIAEPIKLGNQWSIMVNGKMFPPVDNLFIESFKSSGNHFAYAAKPAKFSIYSDSGVEGGFDDISNGSPVLSQNGSHRAFIAEKGKTWQIFIDGRRWKHDFEHMSGDSPVFSPDGNRLVVIGYDSIGKALLLVNDTIIDKHDLIHHCTFSNSGGKMAYAACDGGKWALYVNGKRSSLFYEKISMIRFSDDEKNIAFAGQYKGSDRMVINGKERPSLKMLKNPVFSRDGKYMAYGIVEDGTPMLVRDDIQQIKGTIVGRFKDFDPGSILFNNDSSKIAFFAAEKSDGKWSLYEEKKKICSIGRLIIGSKPAYSPDGKHIACIAEASRGKVRICVDGKPGPEFQWIVPGESFRFVSNNVLQFVAVTEKRPLLTSLVTQKFISIVKVKI